MVRWKSATEAESLLFTMDQVASGEFNPPLRDGDRVRIIDQTRLPGNVVYLDLTTPDDMIGAIQRLQVRGAPALGVAGAFALPALAMATDVATSIAKATRPISAMYLFFMVDLSLIMIIFLFLEKLFERVVWRDEALQNDSLCWSAAASRN